MWAEDGRRAVAWADLGESGSSRFGITWEFCSRHYDIDPAARYTAFIQRRQAGTMCGPAAEHDRPTTAKLGLAPGIINIRLHN